MKKVTLLVLSCCLLLTGCKGKNIEDAVDNAPKVNNVVLLPPPSAEQEISTHDKKEDSEVKTERVPANVNINNNKDGLSISFSYEYDSQEGSRSKLSFGDIENLYDKTYTLNMPSKFTFTKAHYGSNKIKFYVDTENDYAACTIGDGFDEDLDVFAYNDGTSYIYSSYDDTWASYDGVRFEDVFNNGDTTYGSGWYFNYNTVESVKDIQYLVWSDLFGFCDTVCINKNEFVIMSASHVRQEGIEEDILEIEYQTLDGSIYNTVQITEDTGEVIYVKYYNYNSDLNYEFVSHVCQTVYDLPNRADGDFEQMIADFKGNFWYLVNIHRQSEYEAENTTDEGIIEPEATADNSLPYLSSSNGIYPFEQYTYKMMCDLSDVILSKHPNITSSDTANIMLTAESKFISLLKDANVDFMIDAETYSTSSSILYTGVLPEEFDSFRELDNGVYVSQASNGTLSYRIYLDGADLGIIGVKPNNEWYVLNIIITPCKKGDKVLN